MGRFPGAGVCRFGTVGVGKGRRKTGNGQIKRENSLTSRIFEVGVPGTPRLTRLPYSGSALQTRVGNSAAAWTRSPS